MAIEFACSECGGTVRSPNEMAGKRGRCPRCRAVVQIPQRSKSSTSGSAKSESGSNSIEFTCDQCHRQVRVGSSSAGKKGRCPHCRAVVQIPSPNTGAHTAPQKSTIEFSCNSCGHIVKTPASAAGKKGRCPRCHAVVDIPSGGTRTARPAAIPLPELTPLDPFTELPPDPFAGGADAMVGLPPDGSWAGMTPAPMGPAGGAPPFAAPPMAPRSPVVKRMNVKRSGLPWDHRDHADSPYLKTVKMVLFEPGLAFSKMFRKKDMTAPLSFAMTGAGIMYAIVAGLVLVGYVVIMIIGMVTGDIPTTELLIGFALVIVGIVVGVAVTLVNVLVTLFMNAGITHLLLMAVGGANSTFETTLRVHGFVMGTMSLVGLIPCVGLVFALVGYPVYLILGVMYGHETTGERASFAVLLPPVFFSLIYCICCCFNPLLLPIFDPSISR